MFLHCKKYKLKIQNVFKYLSGYNNKEHKNTMTTTTTYNRITSSRQANEHIGEVCSFISRGVNEYGRIVYVTPTSIRIERMQQTADGDFILHPNQKNSVTNNVITFTRKITIASESIAATAATTESSLLRGGIKRRYSNAESTEWLW
jgi:hypothetical protein